MEQHTEEVPAHREPSLHDGTSWVALRPLEAAPVPQPVFLAIIDRIGPSTTGLLTSVHRGVWCVKVDVLDRLRSGSAATSRAIRSWIVIGSAGDSQAVLPD